MCTGIPVPYGSKMVCSMSENLRNRIAVVILAAGRGSRMNSRTAKVLHRIGNREMIAHVVDTAQALKPERLIVVTAGRGGDVARFVQTLDSRIGVAVQPRPDGTAGAVACALPLLRDFSGTVLVLYADTPLVRSQTAYALCRSVNGGAAVSVLGFSMKKNNAYGRIMLDEHGMVKSIVEAADATPEQLETGLCNSGVMAIDSTFLHARLKDIGNRNAGGEYYLTDMPAMAYADRKRCVVHTEQADEVTGINTREELAAAEAVFQHRMRRKVMENGATLADPSTVYFSSDTRIGQDVRIGQNVVFGQGVSIADNVEIRPFCHLEGVHVECGAHIGPFARIRPGTMIGPDVKIGNFVELKKAKVGRQTAISHLSYIGDASIGENVNIGAGSITCNYDGFEKSGTLIGNDAFIGANSALVAPVRVGDAACIGSGSVITEDVAGNDLAIARSMQMVKKGRGVLHRRKQQKKTD